MIIIITFNYRKKLNQTDYCGKYIVQKDIRKYSGYNITFLQ